MKKLSKEQMDELDKIIIQSDELKKRVRIRVPKSSASGIGGANGSDALGGQSNLAVQGGNAAGTEGGAAGTEAKAYGSKSAEDDFDYDVYGKSLKDGKRAGLSASGGKAKALKAKSDKAQDKKSAKEKGISKYKNLGKLTDRPDSKGPSEFRKKSAQWRDGAQVVLEEDNHDYSHSEPQEILSFADKIKAMSAVQWTAVAMSVVLFITAIMTTSAYAQYKGEVNRAEAMANLPSYVEGHDEELAEVAQEVVEEVEPIAAEEPEPEIGEQLSLVMTSVEKDLKIKLVNQEDTLVKGIRWGVTITDSDEQASTYDDEDTDGIIHITDMAAGDYSVTINDTGALSGYTIPSTASLVSVKAKVEYKVIANIKDEIKSEKEVNVAAEDANGNKKADVETGTGPKDTVEYVESTKTENGETYVAADIDWSKVAKKTAAVRDHLLSAVKKFARSKGDSSGLGMIGLGRLTADCNEGEHNLSNISRTPSGKNDGKHNVTKSCSNDLCAYSESSTVDCSDGDGDGNCDECLAPMPKSAEAEIKFSVDVTNVSMAVGATATAKATAEGGSGDVEWSSSDTSIATVSGGVITGVKAGSCTVTAKYGDKSATVAVTVTAADKPADGTIYTVTVNQGKADISSCSAGTKVTITANIPTQGKEFSKWTGNVTFTSATSASTTFVMPAANVTVTAEYKDAGTTGAETGQYKENAQLYDSKNNALYKRSGDTYSLASYQDYLNGVREFFRKEAGYLYTGWQTIDGQTYYYTSDHNYVTGDQVIGGVLYHFGSDGTLTKGTGTLGIDVSKYQPSINWASVKASGINYVIIRCGYRGASTGALIQDPYYTSHVKGAKAAGLKVGVYFFSTALTEMEAVEEASMCAALCSGYGINYPVFIDVEPSSRPGYNSLSAAQRTANIRAFCSTIQSAGYTAGVYANKTWLTSYINTSQLSGYKIWLAQYNAAGPTYTGRYDLWQFTSKGSVNGISGNVDMNQSYLGY